MLDIHVLDILSTFLCIVSLTLFVTPGLDVSSSTVDMMAAIDQMSAILTRTYRVIIRRALEPWAIQDVGPIHVPKPHLPDVRLFSATHDKAT